MSHELTKKVLLRSAELVERGWCQGTLGVRERQDDDTAEGAFLAAVGITYPQGLLRADKVCLDGALMLATHEVSGEDLDRLAQMPLYRAAQEAIRAQMDRRADSPVDWPDVGPVSYVSWNDVEGRTAEEVAALCRQAAG